MKSNKAAARTWYAIDASATDPAVAQISIHDEIGYFGISARDFIAELKALGNGIRQINLSIHSPGGEVLDGLAIYNVLERHPARITATIEGVAASMASVVAMAADELIMPRNAFLMIHNPWGIVMGDAGDMKDTADLLDKMRDTAVAAYEKKTKMPRGEIIDMMDAETWMTGEEAHTLGFVDTLEDAVALAALTHFDNRRFAMIPPELSAGTEAPPAVEPTAPVVEPSPTDPAVPVEPTAPEPAPNAPPAQPEPSGSFVSRVLARIAGTSGNSQEIAQLRAQITTLVTERDELTALVSTLKPKADEHEKLEAALAQAEADAKSASVRAAEIAAAAGFTPVNGNDLPPLRDGEAGTLLDQFNAITEPGKKAAFYREHRDGLRPFLREAA